MAQDVDFLLMQLDRIQKTEKERLGVRIVMAERDPGQGRPTQGTALDPGLSVRRRVKDRLSLLGAAGSKLAERLLSLGKAA
ncbi:MAG: hypothetical protein EDM82_09235 [Cyanobacteria bacterium CYA]|nr:MAG: hypothetical protein EDM82_09235 [Cyanobacteria bacterium CYA]